MTDAERIRDIGLKLGAFRMIAMRLDVAINALHDAGGFAKSVNIHDRYANCFAEREDGLKTSVLPEVSAAIEQLEAEARQS